MKKDYYEILGVSKGASPDQIKGAYRQLAKKHHPDMNPGDKKETGERFKEISEAYEVLMDPKKKQLYDQYGHAGVSQAFRGGGFSWDQFSHRDDLQDILGNLFGGSVFEDLFGMSRQSTRQQARRGGDLHVILRVKLEDVVTRAKKKFRIDRYEACLACGGLGGHDLMTCLQCAGRGQVQTQTRSIFGMFTSVSTCPKCRGKGQVVKTPCVKCHGAGRIKKTRSIEIQIPQGVAHGQYIVLKGEGHYANGGKGSIIVEFEEKPHEYYERRKYDLYIKVNVPYSTLINGGAVNVPGLNGKKETVKIRKGSGAPEIVRARGKGMPRPGGGRGDLYVELNLMPLKTKNKQVKKIIEELKEFEGPSVPIKKRI